MNTYFRVTLYSVDTMDTQLELWEMQLIDGLKQKEQLSTTEIAKLWGVTTRTARTRLKKMIENGLINRIATSTQDPFAVFKLNIVFTDEMKQ